MAHRYRTDDPVYRAKLARLDKLAPHIKDEMQVRRMLVGLPTPYEVLQIIRPRLRFKLRLQDHELAFEAANGGPPIPPVQHAPKK